MPADPPVISATLPRCSPVMFSREARHRLARARRLTNVAGDVERDFAELAFLQQNARGVTCGEADVFRLGIGEAHDLVAPLGLTTTAVRGVDRGFVAPDADQLFGRGAQDVGVDIALPVARMADEHETRRLQQVVVALPVAAHGAGERHAARQFGVHQRLDHAVVCLGQRAGQLARAQHRQEQCAADRRAAFAVILQRDLHRGGVFAVEADDGEITFNPHRLAALSPRWRHQPDAAGRARRRLRRPAAPAQFRAPLQNCHPLRSARPSPVPSIERMVGRAR